MGNWRKIKAAESGVTQQQQQQQFQIFHFKVYLYGFRITDRKKSTFYPIKLSLEHNKECKKGANVWVLQQSKLTSPFVDYLDF